MTQQPVIQQARSGERPLFPRYIEKEQEISFGRRGRKQRFLIRGFAGGDLDDTDLSATYIGPTDGIGRHRLGERRLLQAQQTALTEAGFPAAAAMTLEQVRARLEDPAIAGQRANLLERALEKERKFNALDPAEKRAYLAEPLVAKTIRNIEIPILPRDELARALVALGYQDYGRPSTYFLALDRLYSTIFLNASNDMGRLLRGFSQDQLSPLIMLEVGDTLRGLIQQLFPEFQSPSFQAARKVTNTLRNPLIATSLSPIPFFDGLVDGVEAAADFVDGKRVRRIIADLSVTTVDLLPFPTPFFNLGIAGNDLDNMDAVFSGGALYLLEEALRNQQSPNAHHRLEVAQAILDASPLETYLYAYLDAKGVSQSVKNGINNIIQRLNRGINLGVWPLRIKLQSNFQPLTIGEQIPPNLMPYSDRMNTANVIDDYHRYLLEFPDATLATDSQLRVLHLKYRIARLIEDAKAVMQRQLAAPQRPASD